MEKVIAIFDIGKTNKKLLLFNENYKLLHEQISVFPEITDEDGFPCEDVAMLKVFILDALQTVLQDKRFDVTGVNFSGYGASFVYLNEKGNVIAPLYNYLKVLPETLLREFYDKYGGETEFSLLTSSPVLGNLNSGMQLYRLRYEQPDLFARIKSALHLPQYLANIISGQLCSDITSIGCHTNLWNFQTNSYHDWVSKEDVINKMMPLMASSTMTSVNLFDKNLKVGPGLHDSSAALIPYLICFKEPFVLISTGTWCITLNPFNHTPLTEDELRQDCLCYLQSNGDAVKASRLFAGYEHDEQVKRIGNHFAADESEIIRMPFNNSLSTKQQSEELDTVVVIGKFKFAQRDLSAYASPEEAYHQLIFDMVAQQFISSNLVLKGTTPGRIFVDGGFSKNEIYMNLMANAFPGLEVYATFMGQASALGAALAVHDTWNSNSIPSDIIELKYYAGSHLTL